eukprot:scaffold197021_cov68-Attheya_sp.AAC.7
MLDYSYMNMIGFEESHSRAGGEGEEGAPAIDQSDRMGHNNNRMTNHPSSHNDAANVMEPLILQSR